MSDGNTYQLIMRERAAIAQQRASDDAPDGAADCGKIRLRWNLLLCLFIIAAWFYVGLFEILLNPYNRMWNLTSGLGFYALFGAIPIFLICCIQGLFFLAGNYLHRIPWLQRTIIFGPCIILTSFLLAYTIITLAHPPTAAARYRAHTDGPVPLGMKNLRHVFMIGVDPSTYFFFELDDPDLVDTLIATHKLEQQELRPVEADDLMEFNERFGWGIDPTWLVAERWSRGSIILYIDATRQHGCLLFFST